MDSEAFSPENDLELCQNLEKLDLPALVIADLILGLNQHLENSIIYLVNRYRISLSHIWDLEKCGILEVRSGLTATLAKKGSGMLAFYKGNK